MLYPADPNQPDCKYSSKLNSTTRRAAISAPTSSHQSIQYSGKNGNATRLFRGLSAHPGAPGNNSGNIPATFRQQFRQDLRQRGAMHHTRQLESNPAQSRITTLLNPPGNTPITDLVATPAKILQEFGNISSASMRLLTYHPLPPYQPPHQIVETQNSGKNGNATRLACNPSAHAGASGKIPAISPARTARPFKHRRATPSQPIRRFPPSAATARNKNRGKNGNVAQLAYTPTPTSAPPARSPARSPPHLSPHGPFPPRERGRGYVCHPSGNATGKKCGKSACGPERVVSKSARIDTYTRGLYHELVRTLSGVFGLWT